MMCCSSWEESAPEHGALSTGTRSCQGWKGTKALIGGSAFVVGNTLYQFVSKPQEVADIAM